MGGLKAWMLIPACVAVLAGAQIWVSNMRNELSLETQRLVKAQDVVRQESTKLRLEVASLSRPERLRKYAITRLGMVPPKPIQVIRQ